MAVADATVEVAAADSTVEVTDAGVIVEAEVTAAMAVFAATVVMVALVVDTVEEVGDLSYAAHRWAQLPPLQPHA